LATPFVQGLLRGEPLSCVVRTECAHSARPLTLEIDSGLACRVVDPGAAPRLSIPLVDFEKLDDPSIVDAF
jgi:hypothetical protein